MIKLQQKRDRKEREIDICYEREKLNKELIIREKNDLQKKLDNYKKWKLDNNIEGIKY